MLSFVRLMSALTIVAVCSGVAAATTPCCERNPRTGFRCREAVDLMAFAGQGAVGCWELDDSTCIGGSPANHCICIGRACLVRRNDNDRNPLYEPTTHENCSIESVEGCCQRGPAANCSNP